MKTVLVTGGTIRIGKAISEHLASRGWQVITTSHRADSGADIIADFTDSVSAVECCVEVMLMLGGKPPDALVNNAALFTGTDEELMKVNLEAPKHLMTMMWGREKGRGSVVNILDATERVGKYGETKAALRDFTLKAAQMFAGTLNVNAVALGPVLSSPDVHELAGDCPLGKPTCNDVARAVAFLLEAKSTSGCIIPVDGGKSLGV